MLGSISRNGFFVNLLIFYIDREDQDIHFDPF